MMSFLRRRGSLKGLEDMVFDVDFMVSNVYMLWCWYFVTTIFGSALMNKYGHGRARSNIILIFFLITKIPYIPFLSTLDA